MFAPLQSPHPKPHANMNNGSMSIIAYFPKQRKEVFIMKTEKELMYEDATHDCSIELDKGIKALEELLNSYSWNIEPTAEKALKYGKSTKRNDCTLDEKMSYTLLSEYDRIIWLLQVAHDYCYNAYEQLNNLVEHE